MHECLGYPEHGMYGGAFHACIELDNKTLWVTNGEYASQVNYCPYCGFKAERAADSYEVSDHLRELIAEYRDVLTDDESETA
jgi:hypothetical protein